MDILNTNPISHFLENLAKPFANALGLPYFPEYFPTIAYTALLYTFLHVVIAPWGSRIFAREAYTRQVGKRAKNNWDIHVVSFVNAVTLVYLSFKCFGHKELEEDKTFGWHESVGWANAIAIGYFIWDTVDAIVNFIDLGFVIHGLSCMVLYSLTFKPFLGYYSPRFLLWELSTPFLNIHWFLDKLNMTGSTIQYVNGVFLLSTFFGVRIVYGWYCTWGFFHALANAWGKVHPAIIITLFLGNLTLSSLNIIWLSKMINALRKRFTSDRKQPKLSNGTDLNSNHNYGATNGNGNGHGDNITGQENV
ncbi:TLC domain-containing [Abortiporus biennis]